MTVSVTLETVWLNDAANPADWVSLPTMAELNVTTHSDVETYRTPSGRIRVVVDDSDVTWRTVELTANAVDRDTVRWLEAHARRPVNVRDDRGRNLVAVYGDINVIEHHYDADADVSVSMTETTYG